MYFKYNEDLEITMCFAERKDECSTCANFDICPLVCCVENHLMTRGGKRLRKGS